MRLEPSNIPDLNTPNIQGSKDTRERGLAVADNRAAAAGAEEHSRPAAGCNSHRCIPGQIPDTPSPDSRNPDRTPNPIAPGPVTEDRTAVAQKTIAARWKLWAQPLAAQEQTKSRPGTPGPVRGWHLPDRWGQTGSDSQPSRPLSGLEPAAGLRLSKSRICILQSTTRRRSLKRAAPEPEFLLRGSSVRRIFAVSWVRSLHFPGLQFALPCRGYSL
jgi:hypothetical protein